MGRLGPAPKAANLVNHTPATHVYRLGRIKALKNGGVHIFLLVQYPQYFP